MRHLALLLLAACCAAGEISLTPVDYAHDGTALRGYLALPAGDGPRPGVLVVHEWWGCNDYAQRRARELAEAGYAAFALDMYGAGKTTQDTQQAGAWSGQFRTDPALGLARARAGLQRLAQAPGVDPRRLAAIGFCFGGTVVLELARAGEDLRAVASFHGSLKTTAKVEPGAIKARILVLHGGSDPMVPPAEVAGFFTEMIAAKADWRMDTYGRALHAFTNPAARQLAGKLPVDYDPEAERASFAAMHEWLRASFAR
jgi:dienelactone hydrolase